jgi:small GTP-binding protein
MGLIQKKVCLLGEFAVGKTSLVRRYVEGTFEDTYLSTIGVKISRKLITRQNVQLNLIIWDLAGGENFAGHDQNYLRGAAGAMLVCDLTRPESLHVLYQYAERLHEINPQACTVVAANKSDLIGEYRLTVSELDALCQVTHSQFLFTSAKTGENAERIMNLLADRLMMGSDLVGT